MADWLVCQMDNRQEFSYISFVFATRFEYGYMVAAVAVIDLSMGTW